MAVGRLLGKNDDWKRDITPEHEKQEQIRRAKEQKDTIERLRLEMRALVEEYIRR
jgi:hypothetical protein